MNLKQLRNYALVAAAAGIGAVWAGVPASTVLVVALMLACPLAMLFMHGGHGGHGRHGSGDGGHSGTGHSGESGWEYPDPVHPHLPERPRG